MILLSMYVPKTVFKLIVVYSLSSVRIELLIFNCTCHQNFNIDKFGVWMLISFKLFLRLHCRGLGRNHHENKINELKVKGR